MVSVRCSTAMLLVGMVAVTGRVSAQGSASAALQLETGGDTEAYLRALQIAGRAHWYPWSIRGFSARELRRMLDTAGTSGDRPISLTASSRAVASFRFNLAFNSAFPFGGNDGPVWAGRGLTATIAPGFALNAGPVTLTIAPIAFTTANAQFDLVGNGLSGPLAYNDWRFPHNIDRPQRFGDRRYSRLDPGHTSLRIDAGPATAGISTANLWWGPSAEYPFVLGNNAPGIPHLFVGTAMPANIWIGRLHGRIVWGRLSQSPYSPVSGSERYFSESETGRERLMTGLVAVFAPRFFRNLELGASRFIHLAYPPAGVYREFWRTAFRAILLKNVGYPDNLPNEVASVFARWVFQDNGFEVYGEYGREDNSHDLRDLVQEPEHQRSYLLGFQKIARASPGRLDVVRGELISYQLPPVARDRGEGPIYTHGILRQGHTHRGQLLGSYAGAGHAGAATIAWDRYRRRGKTTVALRRIVQGQSGDFHLTGQENFRANDVLYTLAAHLSRNIGAFTSTIGFEAGYNLNRDFARDVGNLNARYEMRWAIP